jgi:MerR family copper efflux transcriptional regulator
MPLSKKAIKSLSNSTSSANWPVSIGKAASLADMSSRMVRHYESLELLPEVVRSPSGYRQYNAADVHTLRFIRRARDLGFSIHEIRLLLSLWRNQTRSSAQVKQIAQKHIDELESRIVSLQKIQRSLQSLVSCCHGDERPDCPILDDLAAP